MSADTTTGRDEVETSGSTGAVQGMPAPGTTAGRVRTHVGMTLLALFFLFPIVFMFVGSLKPDGDVIGQGLGAFVPDGLTLENYPDAFERASFGRLFLNSMIVSTSVVLLGLS